MIHIVGWKKSSLILQISVFLLFLILKSPAMAVFEPKVVDVTTKSFSVVWTTNTSYSNCGLEVSKDGTSQTAIDPNKIIIETTVGHPGRTNNIAKVTVVGLNPNTKYYYCPVFNSVKQTQYCGEVITANLRGLFSNDPNDTDIVSNDVIHKAVYKTDGKSPALGVLVLAEILDPDLYKINPNNPDAVSSYYPTSAWIGDGMIGEGSSVQYDPNNISYKQYASLNMNNIFDKNGHYPLSIKGDNPLTTQNDSEIVRFTIIRGALNVFGQDPATDWFVSYGRIESVDKVNGEKITTAKVSASFKFKTGYNSFAFPFNIPDGYTTGDLLKAIENAEGKTGIVESIYMVKNNQWARTYQTILPGGITQIRGSNSIRAGQGAFIVMKQDMTKEVIFYGKPDSVKADLFSQAINVVSLPQLPVYYKTGNLLQDIEAAGAGENTVESIYSFDGQWKRTYKRSIGTLTQILNSLPMVNNEFYIVKFKSNANNVSGFDPFE